MLYYKIYSQMDLVLRMTLLLVECRILIFCKRFYETVRSFLLNSPIELFAFKFKNWSFKDNALRYIFILVSLFLIGTLKFLAIPAIILFYIVSSLVNTISVSEDKK